MRALSINLHNITCYLINNRQFFLRIAQDRVFYESLDNGEIFLESITFKCIVKGALCGKVLVPKNDNTKLSMYTTA